MGDAVTETQLLREAETYLGSKIWEKVEPIESLTPYYWNLRKLAQEQNSIAKRLVQFRDKQEIAHSQREQLLNCVPEAEETLLLKKTEITSKLSLLASERDQVIASAKQIHRSYEGLKIKAEVLSNEKEDAKPSLEDQEKINASLAQLKSRFAALKMERNRISKKIEQEDLRLAELTEELKAIKQTKHQDASKVLTVIGDSNKEISTLRAEDGIIETRKHQFYNEIGKYISRDAANDPECRDIVRKYRRLIKVMHALRRSITLNYRLAEL